VKKLLNHFQYQDLIKLDIFDLTKPISLKAGQVVIGIKMNLENRKRRS
jgi:hypothetical protein